METPEFVRNNRIAKEVILVDGAPRSGKSLLGQIISSFERVEIERIEPYLESISILYALKKMSKDAAVTLLRREIDMKLYDSMISRNINFRFSDRTGVFNDANTIEYIKRLFKKEGENVLERIEEEKPIFQLMSHDMLQKADLFFDAFGDCLRIIEMVRHPVDLITSMESKGYGIGIGINPLLWELAIKSKEQDVPYYASGWTDEYLMATPIDRVIRIVQQLTKEVKEKYDLLSPSQKSQVFYIPFEKFVTTPDKYIDRLTEFIGSAKTKRTNKAKAKQRVPRTLDSNNKKKKYDAIKQRASNDCFYIFDDLVNEYEKTYLNS